LVARDMGQVRYVACAAASYARDIGLPTRIEQLRSIPMITSAVVGRQLRVAASRNSERHEVLLQPSLISENFVFLRRSILAGLGVGIVPDYVMQEDVVRGDAVTALDEWELSI